MQERFQTFTVLIARLNRCIRKIKTEEMAEFNLKSPHVSCLYYLYKADSLTAKALCDICEEDKANISRSIEFLEKNGYLVCRSRTEKRYKSPLVLTEKGKEVSDFVREKAISAVSEAGGGISDEERRIFYDCLITIASNLKKISNHGLNNRPTK